jgi:hypothetical protein
MRIKDSIIKLHKGIINDRGNENLSNLGPGLSSISIAFGKSLLDDSNIEEEYNIWYSLYRTYVKLRQLDVIAKRAVFL